jgi:hypothetical protein
MLDLTDATETLLQQDADDTVQTVELVEHPEETSWLTRAPLTRYFAFLAGGGLATLGVVTLIPWFTVNSTFLGLLHVDLLQSLTWLVMGVAGMAAWKLNRDSVLIGYAVAIMLVFITVFSIGNIAFGNAAGAGADPIPTVLRLFPIRDIPLMITNMLNITIAMGGLAAAAAAGLQHGAQASARNRRWKVKLYHSHTKIRTAA